MDPKTPHPLPLSAAQKQIQDDVPPVCAWALINAFAIACGRAFGYIAVHFNLPCIQVINYRKTIVFSRMKTANASRVRCSTRVP